MCASMINYCFRRKANGVWWNRMAVEFELNWYRVMKPVNTGDVHGRDESFSLCFVTKIARVHLHWTKWWFWVAWHSWRQAAEPRMLYFRNYFISSSIRRVFIDIMFINDEVHLDLFPGVPETIWQNCIEIGSVHRAALTSTFTEWIA